MSLTGNDFSREEQPAWSLREEILRATHAGDLTTAADRMGLNSQDSAIEIVELMPWRRGGAETYICVAELRAGGASAKIVLKALVAFTPGTSLDRHLEFWLARRQQLRLAGIAVPTLVGSGNALLIEEFIETDAIDHVRNLLKQQVDWTGFRGSLEDAIGRVLLEGFRPLSFLPNMRVKDGEPCWVDFGEDLGSSRDWPGRMPSAAEVLERELRLYVQQ